MQNFGTYIYGTIYCLKDLQGNIFYVGCTTLPLEKRVQMHIQEAKYDYYRPKSKKIAELDYKIDAEVLYAGYYTDKGDLLKDEKKYIIKFLESGSRLLNREGQGYFSFNLSEGQINNFLRGCK